MASENNVTLENVHYNDCYFSSSDGYDESQYVFVEGNRLPERFSGSPFHVGETGFGTGLNLLCLINTIQRCPGSVPVIKFSSLEKYPLPAARIRELLTPFGGKLGETLDHYLIFWSTFYESLIPGWNRIEWNFPGIDVDFSLFYGDADEWCGSPCPEGVEAWFLDGHSPEKNPDIWSPSVMNSVYRKTVHGGTLSSFTASGTVKKPLRDAGFTIKRKKGFGTKRHMIQGFKS